MVRFNSPQVVRHSSPQRNYRIGALVLLTVLVGFTVAVRAEAPLNLNDAIKGALKSSEESQLMVEKESKLQAQKSEAFAGALPTIQGYATAGRGSSPFDPSAIGGADSLPVFNPVLNRYTYGLQVDQALFSFGRIGQAYKVAGVALKSQAESNRHSRHQLELQALDAFYNAVNARARVEVIKASLKRQGQTVGFLQSNFQMGSGQRSSVLLATSSLKSLEPQRIRSESDADAARMSLNRLVGRPVQAEIELDTTSIDASSVPSVDTTDAGIQKILERRPDLRAMELQKEALSGIAREYRMLYLPSLGFQGKAGILAYKLDKQLTDFDKNLEWSIGIGLQWNIFDGFSQSSKAHEYDSDARSMDLSTRQAWAYARIEIASAVREAAAADTAYEAAVQARNAADEARQMLAQDFSAGKGQVTDLLSAEEGLRNAELGILSMRYQKVRANAALRVALGMDLIEEDAK